MSVSRAMRQHEGVTRCELAIGTPANLELLAGLGAVVQAAPGDLVIAVDAEDGVGAEALELAERELASVHAHDGDAPAGRARPRSLALAVRELDGANVALVSVPGEYATLEAQRALSAGMHVFLFSDHVSLDAELALKRRGAELGLLVMGPECGTAMLGGIGLGFANMVRPGSVGIVAAAGTGAQESACLLDAAGVGVSHIVGVGGRDLELRERMYGRDDPRTDRGRLDREERARRGRGPRRSLPPTVQFREGGPRWSCLGSPRPPRAPRPSAPRRP